MWCLAASVLKRCELHLMKLWEHGRPAFAATVSVAGRCGSRRDLSSRRGGHAVPSMNGMAVTVERTDAREWSDEQMEGDHRLSSKGPHACFP